MDIYLDDVLIATIDETQAVDQNQLRWDYTNQLSLAQHTLKLVLVTTSSDANGSLDAVIVR